MYIREYMKSPVITATPDTLLDEALRTMHEHNIRRIPIVDNGKLVGLVTRHGLREAMPLTAIPLSIWGTHYQLSKMKVRDVMITDVITITPNLLHLLTQILGFGKKGVRLHILSCPTLTCQSQIMEILGKHKANVLSIFSVPLANVQQEDFIIHLDDEKVEAIVKDLKKLDLKVEVRER